MMPKSFEKLKRQSEERANLYTSKAFLAAELMIFVILVLNETRVFVCNVVNMRIAMGIAAVALVVPYVAVKILGPGNGKIKYIMVTCATLVTLSTASLLYFHVILLLILPALIAVQYCDKNACIAAVICCLFCAFAAPLISYVIGSWSPKFFKLLLAVTTDADFQVSELPKLGQSIAVNINKIVLYISLPNVLIVAALSPIILALNRLSRKRLEKELEVFVLSTTDALTGLQNRNSFENFLSENDDKSGFSAVYMDVNGLHDMNNSKGHSAGDQMLKTIASSMMEIFGDEKCYRIGGDEYVILDNSLSKDEIENMIESLNVKVLANHYNVSIGVSTDSGTLCEAVRFAELDMYDKKKQFYNERKTQIENRRYLYSDPLSVGTHHPDYEIR